MPARRAGRMRSPEPTHHGGGRQRGWVGPGCGAGGPAPPQREERGGRAGGRCRRQWRARGGWRLFTGARATCGPARAEAGGGLGGGRGRCCPPHGSRAPPAARFPPARRRAAPVERGGDGARPGTEGPSRPHRGRRSPLPRPGLRPRAASRGCEGIGRRRAGGAAIGGGAAPQPAGGTPGDSSTAGPGPGLRGHVGEEAYAWK